MYESGRVQVLVVEDDMATPEVLSHFLASRGYRALAVGPSEALGRFQATRPDIVILNLAASSGIDVLVTFRSVDRDVPIFVISDPERFPGVTQARKQQQATLISRPFEGRQLEAALATALRRRDGASAREQALDIAMSTLLGNSRKMAEVRELIARVADTDVTVLIFGESGTGKELVARALRGASPRRDKPFVKVNCAALPTELLESELFGFERGAFTGAMQPKPGKFEFAHLGTMFLDEIGEMSPLLQAKLLQVLQDGEFSRLGSTSDVRVDVRIIAATNRALERAVADGQFREDLYFRLNVVSITLPPLRERKEDIPLLAEHFLRQQALSFRNKPVVELSGDTKRLFQEYDWPGNVRELENLIKRFIVLGSEAPIHKELLESQAFRTAMSASQSQTLVQPQPQPSAPVAVPPKTRAASLKEIGRNAAREAERAAILEMLERTRWNRKEAAEILGISYKALLYKIKENRLDEAS